MKETHDDDLTLLRAVDGNEATVGIKTEAGTEIKGVAVVALAALTAVVMVVLVPSPPPPLPLLPPLLLHMTEVEFLAIAIPIEDDVTIAEQDGKCFIVYYTKRFFYFIFSFCKYQAHKIYTFATKRINYILSILILASPPVSDAAVT